jgi:hypothetical protein
MIGIGVAYGAVAGSDLITAGAKFVTTFRGLQTDLSRRGLLAGG